MRIALSGSGRTPRAAAARSSSDTAVQPLAFSQSKNRTSNVAVTPSLSSSSGRSTTSWKAIDTKRWPAGWLLASQIGTATTKITSKHSSRRIVLDPLGQADDEHQRVLDRAVVDVAGQQHAVTEFGEGIEAPAVLVIKRADPVVGEAVLRVEAA